MGSGGLGFSGFLFRWVCVCHTGVEGEREEKKTVGKPRKTKVSVKKNNILIKIEVWDVQEL